MDEVWDASERWSAERLAAWQRQWLREILTAAARDSPAIRRHLESAGLDPARVSIEGLGALPVLRKDALPGLQRETPPFAGWLGVPVAHLARVFRSPGPTFDPEGRAEDYWRFAPALYAAGIRQGDLVLNTLSYHLTPAGHMMDAALRAMACPVVPAGPGNTEIQARLLGELPIAGYIGTPGFLATLLDAAAQAGSPHTLRVGFVIAEMLPESLRARLESGFGVRVSQGYGTADLGSIAFECSARTGLHVQKEVIIEVLDPHTGEPCPPGTPGEVVATALNPTYPLLRFGTGDLAAWAEGPCPCGRTGRRLARILGRVGDAVKVRGMFLHPAELDLAVARHPEVARYQAVVTRTGHNDALLLRAELRPGVTAPADLTERLVRTLAEAVRLRAEVEVVAAGTLAPEGKKIDDRRTWD
jgi:phenylacetate-CoA ligase